MSMPNVQICGLYDCCDIRRRVLHDLACVLDIAGDFKNTDGVITTLYHRLVAERNPRAEIDLLLDNTGSQNKNRFAFAGFQWLCCVGLAGIIRVHFLERGHTKTALDTTFGNLKSQLRKVNNHIADYTTFLKKFRSSTAIAYEPPFILAFRKTCMHIRVPRVPNISTAHFVVADCGGVRHTPDSNDMSTLGPKQNMLPSVVTVDAMERVQPNLPNVGKQEGLREAMKMLDPSERVGWDSYLVQVSEKPKAHKPSAKPRSESVFSQPSQQEAEDLQPSQTDPNQQVITLKKNHCRICHTFSGPPRPEKSAFDKHRWVLCNKCNLWFHVACSRHRNAPQRQVNADAICDVCNNPPPPPPPAPAASGDATPPASASQPK